MPTHPHDLQGVSVVAYSMLRQLDVESFAVDLFLLPIRFGFVVANLAKFLNMLVSCHTGGGRYS